MNGEPRSRRKPQRSKAHRPLDQTKSKQDRIRSKDQVHRQILSKCIVLRVLAADADRQHDSTYREEKRATVSIAPDAINHSALLCVLCRSCRRRQADREAEERGCQTSRGERIPLQGWLDGKPCACKGKDISHLIMRKPGPGCFAVDSCKFHVLTRGSPFWRFDLELC